MLSDNFFENLNKGIQPSEPSCWQKLSDYCSKMSSEQQMFINQQPEVLKVRAQIMEAFSLFLFERFKEEFSKVPDFQLLCNTYIDTVIKAGQEYSQEVLKVMDENKALKARITELEGSSNEQ